MGPTPLSSHNTDAVYGIGLGAAARARHDVAEQVSEIGQNTQLKRLVHRPLASPPTMGVLVDMTT